MLDGVEDEAAPRQNAAGPRARNACSLRVLGLRSRSSLRLLDSVCARRGGGGRLERSARGETEAPMLRIHSVAIQCCRSVAVIAREVARHDGDLARQLRRAMASVALNISEGSGSQGRNRNARYFNALGSANEVSTALEVALAFGYMTDVDAELAARLEQIQGTLHRVLRP